MTYRQFKKLMESTGRKSYERLLQFSQEEPGLYNEYKSRLLEDTNYLRDKNKSSYSV